MVSILEALGLTFGLIHFGVPLAYYLYLRKRLTKPWKLGRDPGYTPKITAVVPTYNEAGLIQGKLDDIYRQDYPRDRIEVVVVDSASTDGTLRLVEEWARRHRGLRVKLIVASRLASAARLRNLLARRCWLVDDRGVYDAAGKNLSGFEDYIKYIEIHGEE